VLGDDPYALPALCVPYQQITSLLWMKVVSWEVLSQMGGSMDPVVLLDCHPY
jgi:hypothetical protein